jgi:hypothetical protein
MNRRERRGLRAEQEKLRDGGQAGPQSSVLSPQSLEVHIEELVLRGFAPGDRYGIGDAVERELTRLLVEQEVPLLFARDSEVKNLDAGRFAVAAEARGGTIGAQIARAVYGGIGE